MQSPPLLEGGDFFGKEGVFTMGTLAIKAGLRYYTVESFFKSGESADSIRKCDEFEVRFYCH